MSINLSQPSGHKHHWIFSLWPLLLFALLLTLAAQLAWHFWLQLLMHAVIWQKAPHQQMAGLLQQVKAAPHHAWWMLMLFSLSYGVLHTLDFSHGKVVIATYLATHPGAAKKQPEAYHLCRFTGAGVGGDRDGDVNAGGFTAFFPTIALQQLLAGKGSFILVMLFGTLLSWRALKSL